jgi:hypothetical protein
MKVILRLNKGITTKTINIPESCVRTEFRVPWQKEMNAAQMGQVLELGAHFSQPHLIFRWDRKSIWGNGKAEEKIPIMDLVEVSL